jgi:membrane-associated phospholipid phosphatase
MPQNAIRDDVIQIHLTRNMYLFIALSAVILWIFAFLLWAQGAIDQKILTAQNSLYENNIIHGVSKFFSSYGMALITSVYILNLLLSCKIAELKTSYPLYILILLSFGCAGIAGDLLKEVFDRARPAAELAGQIARTQISDSPAFPSGHATKSMALALPYFLLISTKHQLNVVFRFTVLSIAIAVCYSRILLQAHYLSDVLAGIGTAIVFFPIAVFLSNKIYKLKKLNKETINRKIIIFAVILVLLTVILSVV